MRDAPYVGDMRIRILGRLNNVDDLPKTGNQIGDTYFIGEQSWVLAQPPGWTNPAWIDP
jgi:hypothetical protein